jgi:hypothetical protein
MPPGGNEKSALNRCLRAYCCCYAPFPERILKSAYFGNNKNTEKDKKTKGQIISCETIEDVVGAVLLSLLQQRYGLGLSS